MKCLAAVLTRAKEPLQLVEREPPPPAPGEVTVEVEACGLGLNDWHVAMLDALPFTPLVLGCEAVGRIEKTGARVGITPLATSCQACAECTGGNAHRCSAATWHGFTRHGALCMRGNFSTQQLVPLPDEGDATELAVLMGSGPAALAAVQAAGAHEQIAVFGLGGVGHLVLQLLGDRAVGFDPNPERLALAKRRGPLDRQLDAAIVCVPSAQAIQRALAVLKPGGTLVIAAASPTGRLDISLHALTARGVRIIGSAAGGRAGIDEVLALYRAGKLQPCVSRRVLTEAPDLLYALRDGGFVGRLVFETQP